MLICDFLHVDITDQFEFFLAVAGVSVIRECAVGGENIFLCLIMYNGHTLVVCEVKYPVPLLEVVAIRELAYPYVITYLSGRVE